MKNILCIIIAIGMLLNTSIAVSAVNVDKYITPENISVNYLYTSSISSSLDISSKTATCYGTVRGISGKTTRITITVYLEKKNGSDWIEVTHQSKTVSKVSTSLSFEEENLKKGTYRTRTVGKVYNGSNYESVYAISKSVSY